MEAGKVVPFGYQDPFSMGAWIHPTAPEGAIITAVVDEHRGRGQGLYLREGRLRFNFTKRWTDLGLRIETRDALQLNRWHHVLMTYDGKREEKEQRGLSSTDPAVHDVPPRKSSPDRHERR